MRHKQNHPHPLAWRFQHNGRIGAPGHLRQVFEIDKVQIGSEGITPAGHKPDQSGENRQVSGRKRVGSGAECIQHFALPHKHCSLTFLDNDLRSQPPVTTTGLRLTIRQFIIHDIDMVNDINNPWHE